MEKRIIGHGLLAGLVAGVVAFVFARVFAEPAIGGAIDYEDAHSTHEHGVELYTRGVQGNVGLGFGLVAFSIAVGALFAVAFIVASSRVDVSRPRALSMWLAAGVFGAVSLVPFLKYPPNPPAVGNEETLRDRTGLYLLMVLLSLALLIAGVLLARRLMPQFGAWSAALVAAAAYVLALAAVMWLMPAVSELPEGFPAGVLYDFRLSSLATQFVMFATIGLVFASLTGRFMEQQPSTVSAGARQLQQ